MAQFNNVECRNIEQRKIVLNVLSFRQIGFSQYSKSCMGKNDVKVSVSSERLFSPLVFLHNLLLLFGGEIILNVEELTDLLHTLALDKRGDLGAREFEEGLDVKVVGGHDDLEEHLLVHVHEVCVPLVDHLRQVRGAEGLLDFGRGDLAHVVTESNYLLHNWLIYLGYWDIVISSTILDQAVN